MAAFTPGTFLIPSDNASDDGCIASATDGSVLFSGLFGTASGEGGSVLANGTTCFAHKVIASPDHLTTAQIFDAGLTSLASGIIPSGYTVAAWHANSPITQGGGKFWIGWLDNSFAAICQVASCTTTGTTGTPQTLDVKRCEVFGATPDGTTLYYADAPANSPIKSWDLTGGSSIGTVVAGGATTLWGVDLLWLPDGNSFLIVAAPSGGVTPFVVRRYSAAGTLLHTYALPDSSQAHQNLVRLCVDLSTPTRFWARTFEDASGDTTTFWQFNVSTGAVITTFSAPQHRFPFGPDPTSVPASCPFYAWGPSVGPTPPFPPGTLIGPAGAGIDDPIRRLRRAPHLWDGKSGHRLKYPGFQLLVESGASRDDDVPLSYFLQWSDDGGHTWSNLHELQGSNLGQYKYRFWWRRLGQSRDRIFQTIENNNAKSVIVDALLVPDPIEGTS